MRLLLPLACLFIVFATGVKCLASPSRVLVVENIASADSVKIARYYLAKRHIPLTNLCTIYCTTAEQCSTDDGERDILEPVQQFIEKHRLNIDYIVLTKGIPIEFNDGAWKSCSIDSVMTCIDHPMPMRSANPYFAADTPFSHKEYGIYLVTRLIGWTVSDCFRLIDSGEATTPGDGPIYLHPAPNRDSGGYAEENQSIRIAAAELENMGVNIYYDQTPNFHASTAPLNGYYTWGSNDSNFDWTVYETMVFSPGAIAETVVSTSGRTFDNRNNRGQSLVADLIHEGVAGCKGYVSEPYVYSMACPELLFNRYILGWNLADSFYAASRTVCWKDIVVGDPLCAPYASQRAPAGI